MVTKVPYLLHARADEDLTSGPLTATDTRQDLVPTVRTEERRGQVRVGVRAGQGAVPAPGEGPTVVTSTRAPRCQASRAALAGIGLSHHAHNLITPERPPPPRIGRS